MAQIVKLRRSSVPGQKPTNSNLQLGELALNTTDGKVYMAKSGSLGPSVEELISTNTVNTGSLHLVGSITASAFSGSASGLTNVPFHITGSDVEGNTYNKQFTKLQFDDSTGLNVSESVPGTAFISIGSHFKDIFVSGSPILSATGSDAFEVIGAGGLGISTSITDTNGNGYIKELTISATSLSSSLNNRMDTITGSISSLSSSVVLTSQTSSMNVLSASYAATASFALNAGGGGSAIGSYTSLVVTSASSTWSFAHNTGQRYPIFQVFDNNGYVVIPSQIQTIDDDNANIIFPSPQTGRVIASLGGGNGTTQEFLNSNLWTVNHNLGTDYPDVTVWDSNKNIIFPNRIESVNSNQVKIYFSQAISGHVSLSRGGHIVTGSNLLDITWANLLNKPSGIVSGSSQLTGSYDTRYVLSGSITQTTWDNIANKPSGLISGSIQVDLTGTTGYSTFSSSISSSIGSLSSSVATTTSGLSSSIDSLSSSVASINNTQNGRLDSLETASGSIRTNFNTFTSSYNTGSFTGSFKGDGTNLYNIPASGVTGLELYKIVSGSVSASISPDNGFRVNTDVYIDGTLTAKEIHTDYVTSSVLYQSGSTKFGDTSDDNHLFTGSVLVNGNVSATSITGSINFNNLTNVPTLVSGSSQINITGTTDYSTFSSSVSTSIGSLSSSVATTTSDLSSSIGSLSSSLSSSIGSLSSSIATTTLDLKNRIDSIEGVTGSISSLNSFTSSINTTIKSKLDADGVISGSSQIIYSGLTGIPSGIVSGSSQISYTGITNIPSGIVSGSEQLTGSYDTRYVLSGSITQTTWNNIASKPNDIVSRRNQISEFGYLETGSFNTYTSSNNGRVSSLESFTASLNTNYVSETEFGTYTGSINTFTSSVNSYTSSNDGRVSSLESKTGSYATTGSNLFKGNQTISGSIIPAVDNTYDLGSLTNQFRDLYLSSASLYIDGTKVLGSTAQELQITTDTGQSFKILEASSDTITLQSADGNITLATSGGGDVIMDPTTGVIALKGTTTLYAGNKIVSSDGNSIQFGNGISITGSIVSTVTPLVSGSSQINYSGLTGIPSGIVSGSEQLTSSYDGRYVLSGSITQTTWDNIASKPSGIASGSSQIDITGTTGYSTFSSSISTSIGSLSSSVATTTSGLSSSIGSLSSSVATTTLGTKNRVDSIETTTGSLNTFSSSFSTAFGLSGTNVTVKGNLTVSGTSTTIDSTTVAIGDNIIQLNGTGATNAGLVVRDATAPNTLSGSLLWDSTNDKWIAGTLGSEDDIILKTATQTLTNKTISGASNTLSNIGNGSLTNSSITIAGASTSLGGTISAATILSGTGTVSGSVQIDLTATTNYTSGILTRLNAVGVFSGSAQVTGIGNAQLTNSSVTVTAGTGMSGGGAVSLGGTVTLTNAGVTSITTNTGLSSNVSATGAVTITNTITNNNQLTNGAGYITSAGTATNVSGIVAVANGGTGASTTATARTNLGLAIGSDVLAYRTFGTAANNNTGDFAVYNATTYVGTTAIALNRASASQTLTGVSIDGNAATVTNFSGTHSGASSGTNTGDQTNISGNAGTVTNGVYTTGDQSISGTKTFAVIKGDSGADYPHSFTNTDAGNIHWTNRGNRMLTSNGTNWASDGKDPIMAIVGSTADTTRGRMIGITFHNDNNTDNAFSPTISFSAKSNSTSYNSQYASIYGRKTGTASTLDTNWNKGELHFTVHGDNAVSDTPTLLMTQTSSTFGTTITANSYTTNSGQTGIMTGNAYRPSANSYFGLRHGSMGASSAEYMIISANADTYISCSTGYSVYLRPSGNSEANGVVSTTGSFRPETNNSIDLGTASYRWKTVYMMDLSLSNGIGDYTIVEGEEKLYLYNNKNNKVYSFVLQEEDPTTAPPKKI